MAVAAPGLDASSLFAELRLRAMSETAPGVQLSRFLLGSPVRIGRLHGDPHPGNFRVHGRPSGGA